MAANQINGGVFFHAVIQGRDITVQLPPEVTPALSGLPSASRTFTGRDAEVEGLLRDLAPVVDPSAPPGAATSRVAVAGLAGVGKTELVVQTAARALTQPGWFPGGVLFVDLFGYDPERRVAPEEALAGFLRALGLPGEHVPAGVQDRTRLYRSVLAAFAEQGRRILVVVDNASSDEQAAPLLPTDGVTAALLTSRHTLDVDARLHDLSTLSQPDSIELLRQILHRARGSSDRRVAEAPEDAAAIARLCAGLPLALRIAAALLADIPTRPLASLAQALRAEHSRLDRLRREDRAVRAAFELSHQHLDHDHARLFRLLPLNPGHDLATESAARLADVDVPQVEEMLQDLARSHLIEPGSVWGRWRLHDLVRLYADEMGHAYADADQRDAARIRLLDFYEAFTWAADTHLDPQPGTCSHLFADRDGALAWLDAECDSLVAAVTTATAHGRHETSAALAVYLAEFLHFRRLFDSSITVSTVAMAACRALGDRVGELTMLNNLGNALYQTRRFDEAIETLVQASATARSLDDRHGEGMVLTNLGNALHEVRRLEEAVDAHSRAAAIAGDTGDLHLQARALNNQGLALAEVRRFEQAIDAYEEAARIAREVGDRLTEGITLTNLGLALAAVGRFEEAIDAHIRDEAVCRELGDVHGAGMALNNLGLALSLGNHCDRAVGVLNIAVTIGRDTGDRYLEARALNNLGNALHQTNRFEEAIDVLGQAVALARETGDRDGESGMLGALGLALHGAHRFEEAIEAQTEAATAARETGDRRREAAVLNDLGGTLREVRRFTEAVDAYTRAAEIAIELGDLHTAGLVQTNIVYAQSLAIGPQGQPPS
ncbi:MULTISPECIES: tetratricopeptide repeat protein [Streptomyces]|uniref:tetratricopeptide repeat protein n=1 Tax=Streptomyces TaxID=1883 RepID=UPI000E69FD2D|nr:MULTISPECIES: tetratricopeptide repeat protein [Streptomyces]MDX3067592.1 tetratricopeptide repeat protein [Streptomyces sp. ND04-05B]MDX3519694.1 tetratricopeptide repeat protein [Streptomyces scabiei]